MAVILTVTVLGCVLWAGGRAVGRRLGDDPLEQGVVGAGIWLAALPPVMLLAFAAGLPVRWSALLWAAPMAAGAAALWRDPRSFGRADAAVLGCGGAVLLWLTVVQALLPVYDGAGWAGDWYEHYQRARFFLEGWPLDFRFHGDYALPSRPPYFNLLAGSILAAAGEAFWRYQIAATFLNLLPLLPLALMARRWSGGRTLAVLAGVLLAPSFVRMTTYPWSRGLAAFFVLLGLHCYARSGFGRLRRDALLAFAFLGTAVLVHYSALVYFLPAGLHFLWRSLGDRKRAAGFALAVVLCCGLVLPWAGWSALRFGPDSGFSNTTTDWASRRGPAGMHRALLENLGHTLLPPALYDPLFRELRDPFYHITVGVYSNSLVGILTLAFSLALITAVLVRRRGAARALPPGAAGFWGWMVPMTLYLGLLVVPEVNRFVGSAQVCLQPLALVGIAAGAAWVVRASPRWAALLAAGILAAENALFHTAFLLRQSALDALEGRPVDGPTLINLELKAGAGAEFLFDRARHAWSLLAAAAVAGLLFLMVLFVRGALAPRRP